MKFHETHFEEYLVSQQEHSLHPSLNSIYKRFPAHLTEMKNLIFYGPKGVGKYTQMLAAIKAYSPTDLKYEKKICVSYNKIPYYFKISDIHFEIDMSLLGCHSKLLWNEVYNQIVDVVMARSEKIGIIVCKNFHEIHSELLDTFYSYMQTHDHAAVKLTFILLSEELSFIPENIRNCCQVIKVPRPTRAAYNRALKTPLLKDTVLDQITNIKNIQSPLNQQLMLPHELICKKIIDEIIKPTAHTNFLGVRDKLYDLFIYHLDVVECMWFIIEYLIAHKHIKADSITDLMVKLVSFLQLYNNNYRPIYHLERLIMFLIQRVHHMEVAAISRPGI